MVDYDHRIILAVLAVWFFLIRMAYQNKLYWPRHAHPGISTQERLLVLATSLWLVPVFLYVFTSWLDSTQANLPEWLRRAGTVLMGFSVLLFWYGHAALDRNWSPYIEIKPNHQLVTSGPYRWMRHPMYLAILINGAAMGLLSASWVIAVTAILPVLVLYFTRVRAEEDQLERRFGAEYEVYAARTGRLLPFIGLKKKTGKN